MKKTVNAIAATLILTYCHTTLSMFLTIRRLSTYNIASNSAGFHSGKPILHSKCEERLDIANKPLKADQPPSARQLCEKLIKTLEEEDKIIMELLEKKHTDFLTHYFGHSHPEGRLKIIAKKENLAQLFKEWEEKTTLRDKKLHGDPYCPIVRSKE